MKTYRIRIKPRSAWGSPWRADSIFGGLAWQCTRAFGEKRLRRWIDGLLDAQPVFVLSDAFPGNWFPAPLHPTYRAHGEGKSKAQWVLEDDFRRMLLDPAFRAPPSLAGNAHLFGDADRLQASIGRTTNLSDPESGGALFEVALEVLGQASGGLFSVYVRTDALDEVMSAFELLSVTGFGRKISTGLGAFSLEGAEECNWLDASTDRNGFVALGHFVPAANDPVNGAWRTHVTYPKYLGNAVEHPFKGRLVQLAAGSWFETPGEPKGWYGRAVPLALNEFPGAVQYGLCLAAPATLIPK